ncbi:MAG: ABC-F family ATP-binding cassette domain-containing protein [Clostridiaceae bacterium]|nr:ABC-F family ATP-binding cassette domain-containing protein [Clostridiaceae bacterium]
MSVVIIENLAKDYFGRPVLRNINLTLNAGERLAVIGDNGSGKTTLLRLIAGLETPSAGSCAVAGGVIVGYLPQDISNVSRELGDPRITAIEHRLRELEQLMAHATPCGTNDPIAITPGTNASRAAASDLNTVLAEYDRVLARYEQLGGYDYAARLSATLNGLGLDPALVSDSGSALSGGELMRLGLARLILQHPNLLLLDEPTNHLDLPTLQWLENHLAAYKGSVIIVSHDRWFIDRIATRVAHLHDAGIDTYPGNYSDFRRQYEERRALVAQTAANLEEEIARQKDVRQTFLSHRNISGYHARDRLVGKLEDRLRAFRAANPDSHKNVSFRFLPPPSNIEAKAELLGFRNLSKAFGPRLLFSEVNCSLFPGERAALVGDNGTGKTTLFRIIQGTVAPDNGTISIAGGLTLGLLEQHVSFADESATCLETMLSVGDLTEQTARATLAQLGFDAIEIRKAVNVLSGGERSRLRLALLIQSRPDILLLDEPTNHLDIRSLQILESALSTYAGAMIVISHDRYFINRLGGKIWELHNHTLLNHHDFDYWMRAVERRQRTTITSPTVTARPATAFSALSPTHAADPQPVRAAGTIGNSATTAGKADRSATATCISATATGTTCNSAAPAADSAINAQSLSETAKPTSPPTTPPPPPTAPLNPAQRRALNARLRREQRECLDRLVELEAAQQHFEVGIDADTTPDEYHKYAELLAEIERLQENYVRLDDALAAAGDE